MTSVELMNNLADFIREAVKDYSSQQKAGDIPVAVYSGWPPIRMASAEKESFIYALALEWEDKEDGTFSTCKAEIGFSIYDDDKEQGCFSLYNIMEHVRQALLKHRTLNGRNRLESIARLTGATGWNCHLKAWSAMTSRIRSGKAQ